MSLFEQFYDLEFDSVFIYKDDIYMISGKHSEGLYIEGRPVGPGSCFDHVTITLDNIHDVKFLPEHFSAETRYILYMIEFRINSLYLGRS